MITRFEDLENEDSPRNGEMLSDPATVVGLINQLRDVHPPLMCQFVNDIGFNLTVGVGRDFGCAQYSSNDGMPPFLMAESRNDNSDRSAMEFVVGGTATPIDGRYRLSISEMVEVVIEFVTTGVRSSKVAWQELGESD